MLTALSMALVIRPTNTYDPYIVARCFLTIAIQVSDADRGRAGHALLNLETLEPHSRPPRDPRTPDGDNRPDSNSGRRRLEDAA
jgi:hypothetical protein